MTPLQFDRWQDFALRMARTCYAKSRRPSAAWIAHRVEQFFDCFDQEEIPLIRNWDHSDEWPEMVGRPDCIGTQVSSLFAEDYSLHPEFPKCAACKAGGYRGADHCRCLELETIVWEQWDDQWCGPVNCCLRAGLDMACAPSAGVVGFTAGDVRRMYPDGVPEWCFPPGEKLSVWLTGKLNGTFAELPDAAQLVL